MFRLMKSLITVIAVIVLKLDESGSFYLTKERGGVWCFK